MKNRLVLNQSNAEYHSDKSALQSSVVKIADSDGWQAAKQLIDGLRPLPTRPLVNGSAMHLAVASMEAFENEYHLAPADYKTATSDKIERWAQIQGLTMEHVLTQAEWDNNVGMAKSVAAKIRNFRPGERWLSEPSFYVYDRTFLLWLKCRPDILVVDDLDAPTSVDYIEVKSAQAVRPFAVRSAMWRFGYAIQQAFYERVVCAYWKSIKEIRTRFVFVENKPPFNCRVYQLDTMDVLASDKKVQELIGEYCRRKADNDWEDDSINSPTMVQMGIAVDEDEIEGAEEMEGYGNE